MSKEKHEEFEEDGILILVFKGENALPNFMAFMLSDDDLTDLNYGYAIVDLQNSGYIVHDFSDNTYKARRDFALTDMLLAFGLHTDGDGLELDEELEEDY